LRRLRSKGVCGHRWVTLDSLPKSCKMYLLSTIVEGLGAIIHRWILNRRWQRMDGYYIGLACIYNTSGLCRSFTLFVIVVLMLNKQSHFSSTNLYCVWNNIGTFFNMWYTTIQCQSLYLYIVFMSQIHPYNDNWCGCVS